jgi:hypothetical protein
MNRRIAVAASLALATTAFAVSAVPAFGDSTGSVAMSIEVAAPCLTISPASVTFPSKPFTTSPSTPVRALSTQQHSVTNCSGGSEQIFARGSNATGTSGASWALGSSVGVDNYALAIEAQGGLGHATVQLSLADQLVKSVDGGASLAVDAYLYMPTAESSGAGQTMAMSVTYTATL